jgi:aryl-alcohol dehydrogenase-like predicted oxidoreductase
VTLIDTAPAYGDAEPIVGEAVKGRECTIATKLAVPDGGWSALSHSETREAARASVERSLKLLGRERIDILQIHNADRELVRRGEVPAAVLELRDEGLAGLLGATVYGEADALAVLESDVFDTVQIAYSVLDRRPERAVLPRAASTGRAVFARSVMLRGVLSEGGRHLDGSFDPLRKAADRFRQEMGAQWEDLSAAALAFVLSRPGITSAVIGPRDRRELEVLLTGADRFKERAAAVDASYDLPEDLIDPRTWPEARVGA